MNWLQVTELLYFSVETLTLSPPTVGHPDTFSRRHIGPSEEETAEMLAVIGIENLDSLVDRAIPEDIRLKRELDLPDAFTETQLLERARELAEHNHVCRSYTGLGYHGTITPPVIQRNLLENPGWYTQYTPYQAEISQGRLEALLNFQTAVSDLTGLPVANASMLDEATAAAEAMTLFSAKQRGRRSRFFVDTACHPQTISVVQGRAESTGIDITVGDWETFTPDEDTIGALVQYPTTDGAIRDYSDLADALHETGAYLAVATDLLALTLIEAPGAWGADAAVGSSQRFGVPMGYGGPHAAFFAAKEDFTRQMPGRIIGVSKDADGNMALRMALQTREQHIRRERATSNICTAQVLLANMAGFYAVYHGPDGLRAIAERVHRFTEALAKGVESLGHSVKHDAIFDTIRVTPEEGTSGAELVERAEDAFEINLRRYENGDVGVALDETVDVEDLNDLLAVFSGGAVPGMTAHEWVEEVAPAYESPLPRTTDYLTHPVFHKHRSEHQMLRYLKRLENRDLSLAHSMIPLGSCTMKLNATAEMMPLSLPGFAHIHPFAPIDQAVGYRQLIGELDAWLCEITGFDAVSFQPNSGAMGEYAGLRVIRAYHRSQGDEERTVCLIPTSAHGTNPASAVIAGFEVVPVKVGESGDIDMDDLRAKADEHADRLGALMITYPSTHGVFERTIREMADIVHERGGLVYMDGANMNAQVGLARPADYGMDVCHLNLHKTFAIPHGGGGPGMGPIGVTAALADFLPGHPVKKNAFVNGCTEPHCISPVTAAPYSSASILTISWAYIAMLGATGLRRSSEVAILNANYMAKRLEEHFDVLYRGPGGLVAHEFILDVRPFQKADITAEDIAKRLIDYGFHAPTMSWPVAGTLMVEPTESEDKAELDRFCEAMIGIREEIRSVEEGKADPEDNVLKKAPHTIRHIADEDWTHPYSREQAAYPAPWLHEAKFWAAVSRVDNAYGDRNVVCTCPPVEAYEN